ncbi:hypothetical protein GCM10022415_33520 [Knoellia locipacati]|uniref:Uncharacterized protein n=1 Tax=Knoellia locipacati TaxID=882824 RepID=A0A512T4T9_9MICO|nr:hypothetical protein [Knoellia locipacati]GEQ15235.1 hypothetical protein KLO01_32820 [Knoellia locipacati]
MSDLDAWVDKLEAEELSQARGRADSAKLVATFAAAIAATLVGTQMQVRAANGMTVWDVVAVAAFGLSALLALTVVLLDQLAIVNVESVLATERTLRNPTDPELISALRVASSAITKDNRRVLRWVKVALFLQLAAASGASVVAVLVTWGG